MPTTVTQGVWNGRRIDLTVINPSILEGERGHTSLFGSGSAVSIIRYAPTFLASPVISGDPKIPATLTCSTGVIDSSPQPALYYQWQADGVDILGENSSTYLTHIGNDTQTITCVVDAVNFLGTGTATSNGIIAAIVEPIEMREIAYSVITGFSVENRNDMNSYAVLAFSGVSGPDRLDITGHDAYVVWFPNYIGDLALINGDAETGDMTGWTATLGSVVSVTTASGAGSIGKQGSYFFKAEDQDPNSDSEMEQVVNVDVAHETDIDAESMYAELSYRLDTQYGYDDAELTLEFLDASDAVLDSVTNGPRTIPQNHSWNHDTTQTVLIPALTRKMRVKVHFYLGELFTGDINAYVDDIRVKLFLEN